MSPENICPALKVLGDSENRRFPVTVQVGSRGITVSYFFVQDFTIVVRRNKLTLFPDSRYQDKAKRSVVGRGLAPAERTIPPSRFADVTPFTQGRFLSRETLIE